MSPIWGYPHRILKIAAELLFPVYCVRCAARGPVICASCGERIHRSASPINGAIVSLAYRDRFVREALWRLKYKNESHVAETLAEFLVEPLRERLIELAEESPLSIESWTVVGAPSAKSRVAKRGYNHAELLAKHIAERLGDGHEFVPHVLIVKRDILQQAKTSSKHDRERNVRGAFSLSDAASPRGKNFIIVDDITTTGATLRECELTLRRAGARRILLAAIAH